MNERQLIERYRKYGYLVYRRCLALLGNRVDAEDAMQEVFVRAQRYRQPYDGETPLPWLYTIAAHCCFDLLKKAGRFETVAPETLSASDQPRMGSESDADHRAIVGAALRRLDAKTREIGLLHHLGGFTQEEVAQETGYSRRTVGKKLKLFEEAFHTEKSSRGGSR